MSYLIPNKITIPNKKELFKILIFGTSWTILTIAPFLLYDSFYMPPYAFLFPSFGIGLSVFSIFFIIAKSKSESLNNLLSKFLIFTFSLFFIVQNYGIYLGTREEINFWKKLSIDIENNIVLKKEKSLTIDKNKSFKNNHIFWLEELYGIRYFRHSLGENVDQVNIESRGNQIYIILSNFDQN